jgi:hypothetical protein
VLGRDELYSGHAVVSGEFVNVFELERQEDDLSGDKDNWSREGWGFCLVGSPSQCCGVVDVLSTSIVARAPSSHM